MVAYRDSLTPVNRPSLELGLHQPSPIPAGSRSRLSKAEFYTIREGGHWHRFAGNRPYRTVAAIVFADGWVFDAVLGDWREQFTLKQLDQIEHVSVQE